MDFSKIEKKWQDKWEKEKIFEVEVDKNKKKFFFTTPYPYISGSLHLGHGRAVTESDIYTRYKRMSGENVLFSLGFHISGTPVLGISTAIKNKDPNKIKLYESYVSAYEKDKKKVKSIVKSFEDPNKLVEFFIPRMINEYKQLGLSIDWTRTFNSGDPEHQQLVSWQFQKYKEKGYLKQGKYPVLYSIEDQSSMGEDDIQEGDADPVEKQEFTLLKFKLRDKFLVAATLRPETVFGQTNLWVNPKIEYFEVKVNNETWVLSKEAVEKLKYQKENVEVVAKVKYKLIGEYVKAPGINKELIVLPSSFVDPDIGTGIVTSVPGHAPFDYIALRDIQNNDKELKKYFNSMQIKEIKDIKPLLIIKTSKFGENSAEKVIEGNKIKAQDDPKIEKLKQEVYKEEFHNGVLLSNCSIYSSMKVVEAKEKIKIDLIKKGQADVMYETSRKAFSRSGGKIIVAILDDQWFLDFNSDGWKKKAFEALKKMEIAPETFRKQFEDTFNWLDKRPCVRKRGLGTQFPFDKKWVIESLSDSTMYMTLYTINNIIKKNKLKKENLNYDFFEYVFLGKEQLKEVSIKTKVKESILKELRESFEYWMPNDHRHTFVLHLPNHLSFMIFAHAALFPEKYWPKKISFHGLVISEGTKMSKSKGNVITLLHVKEKYGADVFRFYITYSTNLESTFDWRENDAINSKDTIEKLYSVIEDSINSRKKGYVRELYLSKYNRILKSATEKIADMKLREFNSIVVFDMLKLVKNAKILMNKEEFEAFNELIVENWIKLISPVMPHISEELWSKLGKKTLVSVEKWPIADVTKIDENLEKEDELVENLVNDINNVVNIMSKRGGNHSKVFVYVIPKELKIFEQNANLLSTRTNLKFTFYAVNDKNIYDPQGKAKKAKPGKPAIFIE